MNRSLLACVLAGWLSLMTIVVSHARAGFGGSGPPNVTNATGVLSSTHGGTGLTTSGSDSTQVLKSNGSGGFVMGAAGGLPSGGSVGQIVVNTGSGTGSWSSTAAGITSSIGLTGYNGWTLKSGAPSFTLTTADGPFIYAETNNTGTGRANLPAGAPNGTLFVLWTDTGITLTANGGGAALYDGSAVSGTSLFLNIGDFIVCQSEGGNAWFCSHYFGKSATPQYAGIITTPTSTSVVPCTINSANGQTAHALDINSFGNTGGDLFNISSAGAISGLSVNLSGVGFWNSNGLVLFGAQAVGSNFSDGYFGKAPDHSIIFQSNAGVGFPVVDFKGAANQSAPVMQFIGTTGQTGHAWDSLGTDGTTIKAYTAVDGTINSAASIQAGNGTAGVTAAGDFSTTAVGHGVLLKSGANGLVGTGTLSGGTATISNTSIGANDIVQVFDQGGTVTNLGTLYEDKASRVNGTSFVIKSSNALDASNFAYVIQKVQ